MKITSVTNLLKPSPFKIGCLLVLVAVAIFYSFKNQKPLLLQSFDNRLTDTMFQLRGTQPTTNAVVIVDIDNKSLKELGQWPWPRDTVAKLIRKIGNQKPKAIILDIVFAEPDRTSPRQLIPKLIPHLTKKCGEELAKLQDHESFNYDLILGDTLANLPTVLGYALSLEGSVPANTIKPFPSANIHLNPANIDHGSINYIQGKTGILNTPDICQAETEGFFNVFPDQSGTIRKAPLFMLYDGIPYPSLGLEGYRIGTNTRDIIINLGRKQNRPKHPIISVHLNGRDIATDEQGQLSINFRGPTHTFKYIPAIDILHNTNNNELNNRYILLGTSAEGLYDLRTTPFSAIIPGVEVQANILDNLIACDPMVYDTYSEIFITYAIVIIGGIGLSAILAYSTPMAGGLGGILCILSTCILNYKFLFLHNRIIGITYPLLTISLIFLCVTLFNFFYEGRKKRQMTNAFKRYVSPKLVKQVTQNPEALSLSGKTCYLTVFFSDIKDFTSISETLSPDQLSNLMNEYLTAMSAIIMEKEGTVDKFIGDAIMAIWGAPLDVASQEIKAVTAALQSIEVLEGLQGKWLAQGYPPISIRIGINSGEMRVGNFGSQTRFDYTVIGDNVNLAARLEGLSKNYGTDILISQTTKQAIENHFFSRYIDTVRVKGKDIPARIYTPMSFEKAEQHQDEFSTFNRAIDLYLTRQFDQAHTLLEQLDTDHPNKLYQTYMDRCLFFQKTPPDTSWNGVFTYTTK